MLQPKDIYWLNGTKTRPRDFPGGAVVRNPPANAEDRG